jgi:hypothetical protein
MKGKRSEESVIKLLSLDGLRRELSRTERLGEGDIPLILIFSRKGRRDRHGFFSRFASSRMTLLDSLIKSNK